MSAECPAPFFLDFAFPLSTSGSTPLAFLRPRSLMGEKAFSSVFSVYFSFGCCELSDPPGPIILIFPLIIPWSPPFPSSFRRINQSFFRKSGVRDGPFRPPPPLALASLPFRLLVTFGFFFPRHEPTLGELNPLPSVHRVGFCPSIPYADEVVSYECSFTLRLVSKGDPPPSLIQLVAVRGSPILLGALPTLIQTLCRGNSRVAVP